MPPTSIEPDKTVRCLLVISPFIASRNWLDLWHVDGHESKHYRRLLCPLAPVFPFQVPLYLSNLLLFLHSSFLQHTWTSSAVSLLRYASFRKSILSVLFEWVLLEEIFTTNAIVAYFKAPKTDVGTCTKCCCFCWYDCPPISNGINEMECSIERHSWTRTWTRGLHNRGDSYWLAYRMQIHTENDNSR